LIFENINIAKFLTKFKPTENVALPSEENGKPISSRRTKYAPVRIIYGIV